jgi:hypothetical protein
MIDPGVTNDQVCVSVNQFGQALEVAMSGTVASAGEAMIAFFLIGVVVGGVLTYLFHYVKSKIDEIEVLNHALEKACEGK